MKQYPQVISQTLSDVTGILRLITRERTNDINEFNNLKNIFISGRKVAKIPSGSADVAISDRVNDINWDANYIYILIDNSGTAEWRRTSLGSW